MNISNTLRNYASNTVRGLTYYLLSKFKKSTWVHIPHEALVKYISRFGIKSFSYTEIDGEKYPLIESKEMKFVGPFVGKDISCSDYHQDKYRKITEIEKIDFSTLDNEHIGLLHNMVIRYALELSSFPYIPLRTDGLSHGSTFVDIGAFRGYVSLKAAKKLRHGGQVYSFEPIPENNKIIEIQKKLNNLENLNVLNMAVSLQEEEAIKFYRSFNQINSEIPDHVSNDKTTQIDVANMSVKKLCDLIANDNPTQIYMSITTNGTEIDLSRKIIEIFLKKKMPIRRIVIPILYTEEEFNKHASFFTSHNFTLRKDYPWCVIENNVAISN